MIDDYQMDLTSLSLITLISYKTILSLCLLTLSLYSIEDKASNFNILFMMVEIPTL